MSQIQSNKSMKAIAKVLAQEISADQLNRTIDTYFKTGRVAIPMLSTTHTQKESSMPKNSIEDNTPTTPKKFYTLTESVKYMHAAGFTKVSADAIRRWEIHEGLIIPKKRIHGTRARVYSTEQLRRMEAIALLKEICIHTETIRAFLSLRSPALKEALKKRFLDECARFGRLTTRAEEILGAI